jgi:hypothetical protein
VQSFIAMKTGDTVTLTASRRETGGRRRQTRQRETGKPGEKEPAAEEDLPKLGLTVQTLNSELKSQFEEYKDDEGALVTDVDPNVAFDAG